MAALAFGGGAMIAALGPALQALRGAEVAHALPGRCRLRLARTNRTAAAYAAIERSLPALPGVQAVAVHRPSGSVVIRFDPRQLPIEDWLRLAPVIGIRVPGRPPDGVAAPGGENPAAARPGLLGLAAAGALGAGALRVGSAFLGHPVALAGAVLLVLAGRAQRDLPPTTTKGGQP